MFPVTGQHSGSTQGLVRAAQLLSHLAALAFLKHTCPLKPDKARS